MTTNSETALVFDISSSQAIITNLTNTGKELLISRYFSVLHVL